MTRILLASLLFVSLAACGSEPKGTSTTKLDAVEVQPGTISDSMILLDDAAGDGTAVDNSVPADKSKASAAKSETDEDEAETADDSADGEDSVTPSGAVAKKAPAEEKK
jgi:hypothetical protein